MWKGMLRFAARVLGVVAGSGRAVVRGHADAGDVGGAECFYGDGGDEGGVDAAAEAYEGFREAALLNVVAGAEDERGPGGGDVVFFFGGGGGEGGWSFGVEEDKVFGEGGGLGDEAAVGAEGERGAVEDERIVSADLVAHGDDGVVALGEGAEHLAADGSLALPEGGGGDVEDDAGLGALGPIVEGPGLHEALDRVDRVKAAGPETLIIPGVFTNGDGEGLAVEGGQGLGLGGLEVALLVEDVVEGQEGFLLEVEGAAVLKERGYVADLLAFNGGLDGESGAEEECGAAGLAGPFADGFEGGGGVLEEGALLEQVGGPVTTNGELGEEDEVGGLVRGALGVVQDFAAVAGEVAYGRVDLGEGDLHWFSLSMMRLLDGLRSR